MLDQIGKPPSGKAGFTLMEVALAIAVVVIGVMALFSLIGVGLDSSAKSIADTQAAMFANDVFGGLRSVSLRAAQTGKQGQWERFWQDFASGQTNLTVAAPDAWVGGTMTIPPSGPRGTPTTRNVPLSIQGDNTMRTIVYQNVPFRNTAQTNIVNVAMRYACKVDFLHPPSVLWSNRTQVTLKVWEGEFGSTDDEQALVFYSEFDNPGDL